MTINDKLAQAVARLSVRWPKRRPKAFYLTPDDWTQFMATKPPTVRTIFGNNPAREVTDPAFQGIPVRQSEGKTSRLYDNTTTGHAV